MAKVTINYRKLKIQASFTEKAIQYQNTNILRNQKFYRPSILDPAVFLKIICTAFVAYLINFSK